MRVRVLASSFAIFALTLVLVVARPLAAAPQGGAQAGPKNLQVLPKDYTLQQVTTVMRTFAAGLGVQCNYCHVADRSSDENPNKGIARKMLTMVNGINDTLKDVGQPVPAGQLKVTCYTCHRGAEKPLTAAPAGGGQ